MRWICDFGFWSFATLRMVILDFGSGLRRLGAIFLPLALALLIVGGAAAQGGYELSWWTVDGGGQTFSTGPGYSLGGTAGQPDAGVISGPGYRLDGGFWPGGVVTYRVYLPLVMRNY